MPNHLRYVSVGKESTYKTVASEEAIGEVESEGFQQSYDVLKRNDVNYYGAAKAIVSKKYAEGSFTMALQPDDFTFMMLHGIMGVDTPGGGGATDERVLSELGLDSAAELPSYTFRVGRDDTEHIFPGQVIESISVSASMGEYAMMSVNTTGAEQSSSTGTLSTSVSNIYTGDAAHFAKSYIRFEAAVDTGTPADYSELIQSIDFEIKTNRDMDNSYGLGSETCIRPPPSTLREVSGSITFHKALGSGDSTAAASEPYFDELMGATQANGQALFNPGSAAPALSALFYVDGTHYIRFDFFKLHFEMPETSISGRDSQTMTVNFHGLFDLGDKNKMVEITCKSAEGQADYDA
jgi:hypothetical protein